MSRPLKCGLLISLYISSSAYAALPGEHPAALFMQQAKDGATWTPHRYLISPVAGMSYEVETQILTTRCWIQRTLPGDTLYIVDCPEDRSDEQWIHRLFQLPAVRWVDADYHVSLTAVPNDLHVNQWHIENTGQKVGNKWGTEGADISALSVWERQVGNSEIIVAIPDTGLYLEHTELQTNLWTNPGEYCDNGIDDDNNGLIDDCNGWDFADHNPDVSSMNMKADGKCPRGHGTFIAGLIGADTFTDDGIAGLNWNVSLMPLKIASDTSDDYCLLSSEGLASSIRYAVDSGAHIISTSFGMPEYVLAIEEAFQHAQDNGVLVTIAAGNDGKSVDEEAYYPIDFDHRGALTVGATNNQDRATSFSNYGHRVDLFAPGHNLYSLGLNNDTHQYLSSGTSYASPLVAGTASLLLSEYPDMSMRQLSQAIQNGVDEKEEWACATNAICVATAGRLNAANAFIHADMMASSAYPSLGELVFKDHVGMAPGDLDGLLERGEVAYLYTALDNLGTESTGRVNATITIDHPFLHMASHSAEYLPVPAGETGLPLLPITVSLSKDCEEDLYTEIEVQFLDLDSENIWSEKRWMVFSCQIDEDSDGHLYPDDCNDQDPNIYPGAVERCNGYDDNCDEDIDGLGSQGSIILYQDADDDGHGSSALSLSGCEGTPGWVTNDNDCDDSNSDTYPGAPEICDQMDNDCDVEVDEHAIDPTVWYMDRDQDGLGDPLRTTLSCDQPENHVGNADDCDDDSTISCEESATCQSLTSMTLSSWLLLFPLCLLRRR